MTPPSGKVVPMEACLVGIGPRPNKLNVEFIFLASSYSHECFLWSIWHHIAI